MEGCWIGREAPCVCVCVCAGRREREGLAPRASSPMLALHSLTHTAFGLGRDEVGDGLCVATLSPLYAHLV